MSEHSSHQWYCVTFFVSQYCRGKCQNFWDVFCARLKKTTKTVEVKHLKKLLIPSWVCLWEGVIFTVDCRLKTRQLAMRLFLQVRRCRNRGTERWKTNTSRPPRRKSSLSLTVLFTPSSWTGHHAALSTLLEPKPLNRFPSLWMPCTFYFSFSFVLQWPLMTI